MTHQPSSSVLAGWPTLIDTPEKTRYAPRVFDICA